MVPTLEAALARVAAVDPARYALTRNALDGAVSGLSPWITHGFVSLADVLAGVLARHPALPVQHKFVFELGWRAYFRHVWRHRGEGIFSSLHAGPLPDAAYRTTLPADVVAGRTGIAVIDQAVHTLATTGLLHNHARLWLASYLVHVRKVHWRTGADWMLAQLLDGDLASNHLSWQWVAGTGSHQPYLFNAENVARFAPPAWHSPGTVLDADYATLARIAADPAFTGDAAGEAMPQVIDTSVSDAPVGAARVCAPDAAAVAGREVWLVHPWALGALPPEVRADPGQVVIGLYVAEFHRAWPWHARRWDFVGQRMSALATQCWHGSARQIGAALGAARRVRGYGDPHLAPWFTQWAEAVPQRPLFPEVETRCDSFSRWWQRATKGVTSAAQLLD